MYCQSTQIFFILLDKYIYWWWIHGWSTRDGKINEKLAMTWSKQHLAGSPRLRWNKLSQILFGYGSIPIQGDEHPFTSYFDVHQGYKGLTHFIWFSYDGFMTAWWFQTCFIVHLSYGMSSETHWRTHIFPDG